MIMYKPNRIVYERHRVTLTSTDSGDLNMSNEMVEFRR